MVIYLENKKRKKETKCTTPRGERNKCRNESKRDKYIALYNDSFNNNYMSCVNNDENNNSE